MRIELLTPGRVPAFFLVLALTGGCATTPEPETPEGAEAANAAANDQESSFDATVSTPTTQDREVAFRTTLVDLDRAIDGFAYYDNDTADPDAAEQRDLKSSYIAHTVKKYRVELIAAAAPGADAGRRLVAVKALGFSEDPAAVTTLAAALESSDTRLLTNATYALSRIADPSTPMDRLIALCGHQDVDVRNNALVAVRKVVEARDHLGATGLDPLQAEVAFPIVEGALVDPRDPLVRGNAAAVFGALRERRAVDSLIDRLRDTHPYIRTHTALALGKIGDKKAIMPLVNVIDQTPRGTPRSAVLVALKMLLERSGRSVPDHLGDAERDWKVFVTERFGPPGEAFER